MDRILPEYAFVDDDNLAEAVYQALGFASVCWSETPTGVFESENASQVGQELLEIVKQYAGDNH